MPKRSHPVASLSFFVNVIPYICIHTALFTHESIAQTVNLFHGSFNRDVRVYLYCSTKYEISFCPNTSAWRPHSNSIFSSRARDDTLTYMIKCNPFDFQSTPQPSKTKDTSLLRYIYLMKHKLHIRTIYS